MQKTGEHLPFRKPLRAASGLLGTRTPLRGDRAVAGRRTAPVRDDRR